MILSLIYFTQPHLDRLSIFKNQREARCNLARSDVVQLLQLGHHDRALLRVEQVVKEQKLLDVFGILEGYCSLLIERVHLIEQERDCPDELKEAISGLIFASSRCGDFPELQEIRAIFVSRYGKEFAARAIELRNNCGVSTTIIQKLSTRQLDLHSRMNVLNEIAAENGIALQLHETPVSTTDEILDGAKNHSQHKLDTLADAAQAAFTSAVHAAAAARAAVELSQSDFHDPDDHNSSDNQRKRVFDIHEPSSKGKETHQGNQAEELNQSTKTSEIKISSPSSKESSEGNLDMRTMSLHEVDPIKLLEKDVVIHESEDDNHDFYDSSFDMNTRKLKGKDDEHLENTELMFQNSSDKQVHASLRAGQKLETGPENPSEHVTRSTGMKGKLPFTIKKGPFSVRTRQVRGY
ncbi:hypothetical protein V6N11_059278 [Hibiscus sabdariffa]|uniref:Uncharacterized protein n=1 Tax=Hibiscus sabdariffa TaxID=183260 RepID=A0ABR2U7H1_9ROSI